MSAHRLGEYVDDVIAVVDAAGVKRSALVGYFVGARIAYAVARKYPGRVSAIAGIGSVGAPGDDNSDWAETAGVPLGCGRLWRRWWPRSLSQRPAGCNLAGTQAEMFALLL